MGPRGDPITLRPGVRGAARTARATGPLPGWWGERWARARSPIAHKRRQTAPSERPSSCGEAGRVERVVQAQQLVLLPGPSPSVAGRRRRRRAVRCREPRCPPADRLRGPTEALSHVLERAPAGRQPHQALVVVGAPAPRVADQPELARPCRHARRGAPRQLAGDLGTRQRAGVAVANHRVLPLGPAATRLRVMQAEVLRVQAQRIGRAAQAVRQRDQIAAVAQAQANRLVLVGQVRAPGRFSPQQHAAPRTNLLG